MKQMEQSCPAGLGCNAGVPSIVTQELSPCLVVDILKQLVRNEVNKASIDKSETKRKQKGVGHETPLIPAGWKSLDVYLKMG